MGIIDWFRRSGEQRATSLDVLDRLDGVVIGRESSAGVHVNELSALQVSTVLSCISRVSLDVAQMPLEVRWRRQDGTSQPMMRSSVWQMLRSRPNEMHSAFEFFQMMTGQAMLYGESFAFIIRDDDGRPREVWPLQRNEVSVMRNGFALEYTVSAYEGQLAGRFGRQNILHLRQMSMDGVRGLDRLIYARNSIGLSQAAQNTQARSYKNGNRMPGYWSTDEALADATISRIADALRQATTGENQWRSPLLDRGMKYQTTGQNFEQAQVIETRKHEMIEVCAAFNVLPAVLGIDDKTQAFASVEAMFIAHVRHTLRPWLVAWEQTIDRDLLDFQGPLYAKFDTSDMEKATTKERAESYRALMETLAMLPNEAREIEGRAPVEGLNELWLDMMRGKSGMADAPPAEPSGDEE